MVTNQAGWWFQPTPLKNDGVSESQLGWVSPIYGKIKNVPNHQPDFDRAIFKFANCYIVYQRVIFFYICSYFFEFLLKVFFWHFKQNSFMIVFYLQNLLLNLKQFSGNLAGSFRSIPIFSMSHCRNQKPTARMVCDGWFEKSYGWWFHL